MAHRVGLLHQFRCLAKISARSRRINHCVDLTLAHNRAGEDRLTRLARDWQRLTGQGRLIDLDGIAIQQPSVCWNNVSQFQTNDIAGDQFTRLWCGPFAIAQDRRVVRQLCLERRNLIARLMLFPERNDGI